MTNADSAGEFAQDAATKAASAAAQSAGAPKPVADMAVQSKAGQQTIRVVLWVAVTLLLIGALLFGTLIASLLGDGLDPDALQSEVDLEQAEAFDIPPPYLAAYLDAGRAHYVPWTLLASVGAHATNHGRIDPYLQEVPTPGPRNQASRAGPGDHVLVVSEAGSGGRELATELASRGMDADNLAYPSGASTSWVEHVVGDADLTGESTVIVMVTDQTAGDTAADYGDRIDRVARAAGSDVAVWWFTLAPPDPADAEAEAELLRELVGRDSYSDLPEQDRPEPVDAEQLHALRTTEVHRINDEIQQAQGRHRNLRVADWGAAADGNRPAAGQAYSQEARQARVQFMVSLLDNPTSGGQPTDGTITGEGVLPTPTGDCPTLPQTISGPDRQYGAGPLMLRSDMFVEYAGAGRSVADPNVVGRVQNICHSADALAAHLAEVAENVGDVQQLRYPEEVIQLAQRARDEQDAEADSQLRQFWAVVLDEAVLLGDTDPASCPTPARAGLDEQDWVGVTIDRVFNCVLRNAELAGVTAVEQLDDGEYRYELLSTSDARARAVREAASVAWLHSAWGEIGCEVFPLPQHQFDQHVPPASTDADPCDAEAGIHAAARAYAAAGSEDPDPSAGHAALAGGWSVFDAVAGSDDDVQQLAERGPWSQPQLSNSCQLTTFAEIVERAQDPDGPLSSMTAGQVLDLRFDAPEAGTASQLDQLLDTTVDTLRGDPACEAERDYSDTDWLRLVHRAYISDPVDLSADDAAAVPADGTDGGQLPSAAGAEVEEPVTGPSGTTRERPRPETSDPDARDSAPQAGDIAAALVAYANRSANEQRAAAGDNAPMLPRLSAEELDQRSPPSLPSSLLGRDGDGVTLVGTAERLYGGVRGGDRSDGFGGEFGQLDSSIPHAQLFNEVGEAYGVDPRLLAAVARQESNFDEDARCDTPASRAGFGMMQAEADPSVCGDPRAQIVAGAEHLLAGYERSNGSWKGALWGYNNGLQFADDWPQVAGDPAAKHAYALEHYQTVSTFADTRAQDPSWPQYRADVAVSYVSADSTHRSAYRFWQEYKAEFPSGNLSARSSDVDFGSEQAHRTADGSVNIVSVQGIQVNVEIAGQVDALLNDARANGIELGGGGFRSHARQIELRRSNCGDSDYAIWQMPSSRCSPPTAIPGNSQHELGLAVDFTYNGSTICFPNSAAACRGSGNAGFDWLDANAHRYGLQNLPSEAWHWSTTGR